MRGMGGYQGIGGRTGVDGQSVVLDADGSPQVLNLSGTDGEPGRDGTPGQWATGCYQPMGFDNDWGVQGGDGGNGGNGGRGGDAGDLTAYFDDASQLRTVYVQARPGRGAPGGYGAYGGDGCRCSTYTWQLRRCSNTQPPQCQVYTFRCTDGQRGMNGIYGIPGRAGHVGAVTLIAQRAHLGPDHPTAEGEIASLAGENRFELTSHRWSMRTGARQLFAPGSEIADEYRHYDGLAHKTVILKWEAPRSPHEFADDSFSLALVGETVTFDVSPGLWIDATHVETLDTVTITVRQAVRAEDVAQLKIGAVTGVGTSFSLAVDDLAQVSDAVTTRANVTITGKKIVFYKKIYQGPVAPELIVSTREGLRLDLGRLPFDAQAELRSGRKLKIKLELTRSFGGNSRTVTLEAKPKLQ